MSIVNAFKQRVLSVVGRGEDPRHVSRNSLQCREQLPDRGPILDPSPEAILTFANKYGDIGLGANRMFDGVLVVFDGASLYDWQNAITEIDRLLQEAEKLAVNRRKNAQSVAALIDGLVSAVPVYLSTVIQKESIGLRANTKVLIDAMKLQLVESIVESKQYRACVRCGKPFEITQISRSDRIYCSDNCRVKAYQRRKKVIALRSEGCTFRAIVEETGLDIRTIKQWLQPKGK